VGEGQSLYRVVGKQRSLEWGGGLSISYNNKRRGGEAMCAGCARQGRVERPRDGWWGIGAGLPFAGRGGRLSLSATTELTGGSTAPWKPGEHRQVRNLI